MGSASLSSSYSLSLSEDASGEDEDVVVLNGSLRYVDDGTVLAKSPKLFLPEVWEEGRRRRVGRSEALRMVGLAFRGSAIMQSDSRRTVDETEKYKVCGEGLSRMLCSVSV